METCFHAGTYLLKHLINIMKKLFLLVAFIATAFVQPCIAQHEHATDQASSILAFYYNVKDALVAGNESLAATAAGKLITAINATDDKTLGNAGRQALLKQAGMIAESNDLKIQREHFAALSTSMISVAKTTKLTAEPVYQMYCPMKKSNWLSNEKAIKNPYYGSAMLTCGKVVETIK